MLLSPESKLSDAIEEGNYPRAYAILRRLTEPLKGDMAADCLIHSFSRTDRLFRAVLDHLSPEVRTGSMSAAAPNGAHLAVTGSLLTVAAALGSETHVKALLARGFDINAAAPDCIRVEPIFGVFGWAGPEHPYGPRYRFCAAPGNRVTVTKPDGYSFSVNGCTPLAAAIAAGNDSTIDALLKAPGVWKEESSAVCRAAALEVDGRSFDDWGSCCYRIFEALDTWPFVPGAVGHIRDVPFRLINMQPDSFADFCSTALLKAQYESGTCTADDARRVLATIHGQLRFHRAIPPHMNRKQRSASMSVLAAKLLMTAKHFPDVCREPACRDVFLLVYLHSVHAKFPKQSLLSCWKKLCGTARDISCCAPMIFSLQGEARKECLEALAAGGALYASADALHPDNTAEMRDMLQYLHIVPSPYRSGISAFAAGVLALSPNARSMQKLFSSGALSGEPKEALLLAADRRLRPLILLSSFAPPAETYDPARVTGSFNHIVCTSDDDMDVRRQSMLCGDMDEENCLLTLLDPHLYRYLSPQRSCDCFPELDSVTLPILFICAENPNALRAWLRMKPDFAGETIGVDLQRGKSPLLRFIGPPLALAAAAGQTENVRLLLEADPCTDVCCAAITDDETRSCTPLWLALCFGREDAARFLLSRGARLESFGAPEDKAAQALPPEGLALWKLLRGQALEAAV